MRTALLLCLAAAAIAQERPRPAYEVVSIKKHEPGAPYQSNDALREGGRLRLAGIDLGTLIMAAFREPGAAQQLSRSQIVGLPDSAAAELYDIDARPEPGFVPTYDEAVGMLRALLEDRFALKTHVEMRDETALALTIAKQGIEGGKGLRLSADQTPVNLNPTTEGARADDPAKRAVDRGRATIRVGKLTASANSMTEFAAFLSSSAAGRQVVDKTGLKGLYDIEFQYTPDFFRQLPADYRPPEGAIIPNPDGPTLFEALEQQLGLKVVSATAPVRKIVIDHVEKPSPN